ncbi:MAG: hypothetical protein U1E51_26290 [Candidatus Binatia bacterium]|nr:hypothetical protein [Candidatus Binatia bacterium]
MPLDRIQARKRINGARSAYGRGVHAEFINNLATDLEEALNLLDGSTLESQRALNEVARMQRELDDEKTHYRKLREQSAHTEAMVALLKEIAASPKGAAKKAAELLKAAKMAEPAAVAEKMVVP